MNKAERPEKGHGGVQPRERKRAAKGKTQSGRHSKHRQGSRAEPYGEEESPPHPTHTLQWGQRRAVLRLKTTREQDVLGVD